MQNVQFSSVEECLEWLPADELKIVNFLRRLVLECIPDVSERLSFNVPYYFRHSNICFIWPGSVSWGSVHQKGVRLGFASGYLMNDDIGYLDKGNRKQIYWRDFYDVKDIDAELLRTYIYDAVVIDEQKAEARRRAKKVRK